MIRKLKVIEIQTISNCNSHCIVCPWIKIKDSVTKLNMSEYVWSKVLEGISMLKPEIMIPYMNNEPLLDKDIASRIHDLRSLNEKAQIEFSTNGLLLSEKSSSFLVNHADIILISLFGSDEISNTRLMGEGMSYQKIKQNILNLKKAKEDSGSQSIINIVKLKNNPFLSNNIVWADSSFWESEGIDIRYYSFVDRSGTVGDFKQRENSKIPRGCALNRHNERTYIHSNGDVCFCCHDWRREYLMGNLNENSLIEIVNGEQYKRIRDMVDGVAASDDNFLCRKCLFCL